jgi:2-polyprenyl-6-hydroxyphenyl methylase/3-demethylubiquinone-9 3-methyltransferase
MTPGPPGPAGEPAPGPRFEFGANWRSFSRQSLDPRALEAARLSLAALLGPGRIRGARFVDVGCGSGLFSLAAAGLGAAEVLGFDLDPEAVRTSRDNLERLLPGHAGRVRFVRGSILDPAFTAALAPAGVVYAWGSLHHTGAMWRAVEAAAGLTAPGGVLALALYARHWTSPLWQGVKRLYNALPGPGRRAMEWTLTPPLLLGAWATTGRWPLARANRDRGMDFRHDLIDWIGGYPYEYASPEEVAARAARLGLRPLAQRPQRGWTGCAEYVFLRPGP